MGAELDHAVAARVSLRARAPRRAGLRAAGCALLVLLVSACAAAPAAPRQATVESVRTVLTAYEASRDFSGVALIVDRDGQTLLEDARGLADKQRGVPITASTRFQIASISKLFAAVAVLREVDRGRLDLEAPIGTYVPNLPPKLAQPTLAELLAHTAGLRRESPLRPDETLTVAEHVGRLTDAEVEGPRGPYVYSNTGYVLLARAVEIVSGKPFDQALRADVLTPAGLRDTGFIVGDEEIPRLAVGYARGLDGWRVPPRARHRGVYPPGGLYSTARDLARFMRLLRDGALLSRAGTEALFQSRIDLPNGQTASFAGVTTARNGERYLLIAGSADGGKAVLMEAMNEHRTTMILTNVGDVPITELLRDVTIATEGGAPASPKPCRLSDAGWFAARVGRYDFTGTGLEQLNGTDRYMVGLIVDRDRAFLWDAEDDSVTLLCEGAARVLTPAYTAGVRLSLEGSAEAPILVFDWERRRFSAARADRSAAPCARTRAGARISCPTR